MPPVKSREIEARDAEQVNQAQAALAAGDLAKAERLLLAVIANTPMEYANASEGSDGSLTIKFWDQQAFVHYVMWQKPQGCNRSIQWLLNAYPKAHYYAGFLCLKSKRYQEALRFLERGQQLEPTNPKFNFEKAQALVRIGQAGRALALYETVNELGPFVSNADLAVARRGRGFVLIELGRLDEAEEAFKSSLEIEPGNPIALNELRYIQHLRKGGNAAPVQAVPTQTPGITKCSKCGKTFTKGVVVSDKGTPRSICATCDGKLNKQWWQFWK